MPEFSAITQAQWDSLAQRRIYFGHQSVGRNIVAGIDLVLKDNPQLGLRHIEGVPADSAPGLYHQNVGQNRDIDSKRRDFAAATDSAAVDAAMIKFCYVDITGDTDPDSLFASYREWIASVQQRHPGMRIVHATLPLTDLDGRRDWLMGKIRGEATKRDLNYIRHRYNTLLRAEYAGKAPIFDIAALESTRDDGTRTTFRYKGEDVPFMNPELTNDGGHLNVAGQRKVAERFLALLASQ
jgi:lysophospholipase L1-like esterase